MYFADNINIVEPDDFVALQDVTVTDAPDGSQCIALTFTLRAGKHYNQGETPVFMYFSDGTNHRMLERVTHTPTTPVAVLPPPEPIIPVADPLPPSLVVPESVVSVTSIPVNITPVSDLPVDGNEK